MYPPLDRRWIVRWIAGSMFANLLGGGVAVGIALGAYDLGILDAHAISALAVGAVAGLAGGVVVGHLGAASLPRTVERATWIRGTVAGAVMLWMLVALTPALLVTDPGAPEKPFLARVALAMCVGASAGMLLAAFQAPALETTFAVRRRPWLLGNGAAWGTATPITYSVTGLPSSSEAMAASALLLLAVAGLAGGVATALTLLLEERRAQLIGQSAGRTCATELV